MIDEIVEDANERMGKSLESLQQAFAKIRTGRANPSLLDGISVEYYGSPVPIQQLAAIQVPEARMLLIKPHDRSILEGIEKAIRDSDLGVNPNSDGVVIRLNFPPLTEERRREYVKVVKHMEAAQHDGEISEDELDRAEKELEKVTHDHTDKIDAALERKEAELLEV